MNKVLSQEDMDKLLRGLCGEDEAVSQNKREKPKCGDVFRHFKGKYYFVMTLAHHSEEDKMMVVYKAMYGEHKVCCRPLDMFMSEVDHEKYPDVEQLYRFELVGSINE